MKLHTLGALCLTLLGLTLIPASVDAQTSSETTLDAANFKQTTVVHLWATWCSNCKNELQSGGWKKTVKENPTTHFVFMTVWCEGDGREMLAKYGVGGQKNVKILASNNPSRLTADRTKSVLGLPLTWVPTTLVYSGGALRYSLNYGEIRFPMLQEMITDCSSKW
jgi:thiol-disulfide isomerase/thioredoxin